MSQDPTTLGEVQVHLTLVDEIGGAITEDVIEPPVSPETPVQPPETPVEEPVEVSPVSTAEKAEKEQFLEEFEQKVGKGDIPWEELIAAIRTFLSVAAVYHETAGPIRTLNETVEERGRIRPLGFEDKRAERKEDTGSRNLMEHMDRLYQRLNAAIQSIKDNLPALEGMITEIDIQEFRNVVESLKHLGEVERGPSFSEEERRPVSPVSRPQVGVRISADELENDPVSRRGLLQERLRRILPTLRRAQYRRRLMNPEEEPISEETTPITRVGSYHVVKESTPELSRQEPVLRAKVGANAVNVQNVFSQSIDVAVLEEILSSLHQIVDATEETRDRVSEINASPNPAGGIDNDPYMNSGVGD